MIIKHLCVVSLTIFIILLSNDIYWMVAMNILEDSSNETQPVNL